VALPPNVLVIVTDQQRRDTVGAYGSRLCRTPNMDRLAADGIRFDRAYTPTGLCSPVRSSFFSGTYPHEHEVLTNVALHPIRQSLRRSHDRLTPVLAGSGYRLGYVGKWHVSHHETPLDFGFHDYVSLGDYMTWRKAQGHAIHEALEDYTRQRAERDFVPVAHTRPAWLCDQAIRLIDRYRADAARPFFLRLDFHGPHFPNVVPEPYFSMYPPHEIPPWPNAEDTLDGKPTVHRIKKLHWRTDEMAWSDWQLLLSAYFGETTLIDHQVGRVLDHLEASGAARDTLVVWTSDHGDTAGSHGICNKDYSMYEEVYAVPLVARWPGVIAPGRSSDAWVMHLIDLHATLRDLCGAPPAAPCHGRSLLPLLRGEATAWPRDSAYAEFHGSHMGLYSMRLLRTERWSYVYNPNDIDELYDNLADPAQLHNLAGDGAHRATLEGLRRRMVEWMRDTEDHLFNEWTVDWLTKDPELAAAAPGRRRTTW
jgi:arylsulfatase A-like enzyme